MKPQPNMSYILFVAGNKQWIHPPDALSKGHVIYLCKVRGHGHISYQCKGECQYYNSLTLKVQWYLIVLSGYLSVV